MPWQNASSPRPNKLLFWSLVVLAVAMVFAVAFAIRRFNRDISRDTADVPVSQSGSQTKDAPMPEDMKTPQPKALSGFVSEVISKKDSSEKWIKLSVTLPESMPATPPGKNPKPITVKMKTATYLFYLGETTENGKDIKGGEQVTLSFFGEPSEKDYMSAEKVEIRQE